MKRAFTGFDEAFFKELKDEFRDGLHLRVRVTIWV